MKRILLITLFWSVGASASFLPPDFKVDLSKLSVGPANITESEFRQIISRVQQEYAPVVSSFGGQLTVSGDWRNEQPNAQAGQILGQWRVQITGGLARRPELTADGFTLILCHELGHHLGGFPFAPAQNPFMGVWAANEGQADYFATHVCARRLWSKEASRNAEFRQIASSSTKQQCDRVWSSIDEQNLCYRSLTAVESLIATMAALMQKPMPTFETPDATAVDKTFHGHPQPQCRMDTSLQGAICQAEFNQSIIPGKTSNGGSDSTSAEQEAAFNSCTALKSFNFGLRPRCWYYPRM